MPPRTSAISPTRARRWRGMIVDEGVIVEIVRPGTGDPVAEGEVGEVVGDDAEPRLSADPLRHRRPFRRVAGGKPLRTHQHADQGLDGPCGPDHQDQGHVRAPRARWRNSSPRHAEVARARVVATRDGEMDVMTVQGRGRGARCGAVVGERGHGDEAARQWSRSSPPGACPTTARSIDDQRNYRLGAEARLSVNRRVSCYSTGGDEPLWRYAMRALIPLAIALCAAAGARAGYRAVDRE